jgi:hypothetical protein
MFPTVTTSGALPQQSARQRPLMMLMQEFSQLLAQAFILFTLMTEYHGPLEQCVLQLLWQLAPKIRRRGAKNKEIAGGDIIDNAIRGTHAALLPPLLKCYPRITPRTGHDPTASRKYGSTV